MDAMIGKIIHNTGEKFMPCPLLVWVGWGACIAQSPKSAISCLISSLQNNASDKSAKVCTRMSKVE